MSCRGGWAEFSKSYGEVQPTESYENVHWKPVVICGKYVKFKIRNKNPHEIGQWISSVVDFYV